MQDRATKKHKPYVWNHLCPLCGALSRVYGILYFLNVFLQWMYGTHNDLNYSNPVSVIVA